MREVQRIDVVLDHDHHDFPGVRDHPVAHAFERRHNRIGAELAESVAKVECRLARLVTQEPVPDPDGGLGGFRTERTLNLVQRSPFMIEISDHVLFRRDAVVHVDEQGAHAVLELARKCVIVMRE